MTILKWSHSYFTDKPFKNLKKILPFLLLAHVLGQYHPSPINRVKNSKKMLFKNKGKIVSAGY
jgi:hypothetical protein